MNIKKYLLLFLAAASLPLAGCSSDDSDDGGGASTTPTIEVSNDNLTFTADGGKQDITITVNHEWGATVTTGNDWVTISPSSNTSSTGGTTTSTVTVASNPTTSSRTATITIASGLARKYVTVNQQSATTDAYDTPTGYTLVWHDEFDKGTELSSDWTHEVQGPGWVNHELQNYVNHVSPAGNPVTEISNGSLHIRCFKENGQIYSGRVYAKVNTGWKYGYFEARIRLPKGKGTWPAWWMMPVGNNNNTNPWPGCGEIDIMEEVGVDANNVTSTIHCNKYNNGNTATEHGVLRVPTAESDYHVYACEWTDSKLEFFVDGQSILKYEPTDKSKDYWPFNVPFYPILNLAWGGDWGGMNGVDETALPITMDVDYVRIFQKN